jgi:hypothetical protein
MMFPKLPEKVSLNIGWLIIAALVEIMQIAIIVHLS